MECDKIVLFSFFIKSQPHLTELFTNYKDDKRISKIEKCCFCEFQLSQEFSHVPQFQLVEVYYDERFGNFEGSLHMLENVFKGIGETFIAYQTVRKSHANGSIFYKDCLTPPNCPSIRDVNVSETELQEEYERLSFAGVCDASVNCSVAFSNTGNDICDSKLFSFDLKLQSDAVTDMFTILFDDCILRPCFLIAGQEYNDFLALIKNSSRLIQNADTSGCDFSFRCHGDSNNALDNDESIWSSFSLNNESVSRLYRQFQDNLTKGSSAATSSFKCQDSRHRAEKDDYFSFTTEHKESSVPLYSSTESLDDLIEFSHLESAVNDIQEICYDVVDFVVEDMFFDVVTFMLAIFRPPLLDLNSALIEKSLLSALDTNYSKASILNSIFNGHLNVPELLEFLVSEVVVNISVGNTENQHVSQNIPTSSAGGKVAVSDSMTAGSHLLRQKAHSMYNLNNSVSLKRHCLPFSVSQQTGTHDFAIACNCSVACMYMTDKIHICRQNADLNIAEKDTGEKCCFNTSHECSKVVNFTDDNNRSLLNRSHDELLRRDLVCALGTNDCDDTEIPDLTLSDCAVEGEFQDDYSIHCEDITMFTEAGICENEEQACSDYNQAVSTVHVDNEVCYNEVCDAPQFSEPVTKSLASLKAFTNVPNNKTSMVIYNSPVPAHRRSLDNLDTKRASIHVINSITFGIISEFVFSLVDKICLEVLIDYLARRLVLVLLKMSPMKQQFEDRVRKTFVYFKSFFNRNFSSKQTFTVSEIVDAYYNFVLDVVIDPDANHLGLIESSSDAISLYSISKFARTIFEPNGLVSWTKRTFLDSFSKQIDRVISSFGVSFKSCVHYRKVDKTEIDSRVLIKHRSEESLLNNSDISSYVSSLNPSFSLSQSHVNSKLIRFRRSMLEKIHTPVERIAITGRSCIVTEAFCMPSLHLPTNYLMHDSRDLALEYYSEIQDETINLHILEHALQTICLVPVSHFEEFQAATLFLCNVSFVNGLDVATSAISTDLESALHDPLVVTYIGDAEYYVSDTFDTPVGGGFNGSEKRIAYPDPYKLALAFDIILFFPYNKWEINPSVCIAEISFRLQELDVISSESINSPLLCLPVKETFNIRTENISLSDVLDVPLQYFSTTMGYPINMSQYHNAPLLELENFNCYESQFQCAPLVATKCVRSACVIEKASEICIVNNSYRFSSFLADVYVCNAVFCDAISSLPSMHSSSEEIAVAHPTEFALNFDTETLENNCETLREDCIQYVSMCRSNDANSDVSDDSLVFFEIHIEQDFQIALFLPEHLEEHFLGSLSCGNGADYCNSFSCIGIGEREVVNSAQLLEQKMHADSNYDCFSQTSKASTVNILPEFHSTELWQNCDVIEIEYIIDVNIYLLTPTVQESCVYLPYTGIRRNVYITESIIANYHDGLSHLDVASVTDTCGFYFFLAVTSIHMEATLFAFLDSVSAMLVEESCPCVNIVCGQQQLPKYSTLSNEQGIALISPENARSFEPIPFWLCPQLPTNQCFSVLISSYENSNFYECCDVNESLIELSLLEVMEHCNFFSRVNGLVTYLPSDPSKFLLDTYDTCMIEYLTTANALLSSGNPLMSHHQLTFRPRCRSEKSSSNISDNSKHSQPGASGFTFIHKEGNDKKSDSRTCRPDDRSCVSNMNLDNMIKILQRQQDELDMRLPVRSRRKIFLSRCLAGNKL